MDRLPDLSSLSHAEKDALIHALWAQVQALTARVAELEARRGLPPKTPDNSSLPPSQGKKPNRGDKPARCGPRQGSLGRQGGGRTQSGGYGPDFDGAGTAAYLTARPVNVRFVLGRLRNLRPEVPQNLSV